MKFVLDIKEWRVEYLMFCTKWDSLRKKCAVTVCKQILGKSFLNAECLFRGEGRGKWREGSGESERREWAAG